jgi:hypothetical protein
VSRDLLERPMQAGDYRLEFDVAHEDGSFFTKIAVDIRVEDPERSYHVPLLLAPFSMTTYRGVLRPSSFRGGSALASDREPVDIDPRPTGCPRGRRPGWCASRRSTTTD